MRVAKDEVVIPVVIDIEETNTPAAVHLSRGSDPCRAGFIGEQQLATIPINGKSLAVEVADEQILQTIAIVIGRIDSHSRSGISVRGVGNPGLQSDLIELSVAAIHKQEVRDGIIRDEKIE